MKVASTVAALQAKNAGDKTVAWHSLTSEEACERLGVEVPRGLDAAEVERRRAQVGPNKLAEAEKEPGWRVFLRQYRDLMQLVLLGAAIVSMVALQEFSTGVVIIGVTVAQRAARPQPGGQGGRERRGAAEDARHQGACASRGQIGRHPGGGARARVTSSCSRPATRSLPTGACSSPRPSRSRRPRSRARARQSAKTSIPSPGDAVPLGDRLDMAYMNSTGDARPRRDGRHGDGHDRPRSATSRGCSAGSSRRRRRLHASSTS